MSGFQTLAAPKHGSRTPRPREQGFRFRYEMFCVVPSLTVRYSDKTVSIMQGFHFSFCVTQTLTRRVSSQHFVPTDTAVSGTTDVFIQFISSNTPYA